MTKDLILQGKKFISSRRAAEMTGYTNDYIGQLCRAGKVKAQLVGRNWYVEEQSLFAHKLANGKTPPKVFDNFFSAPSDSVSKIFYNAEEGFYLPVLKSKTQPSPSSTSNKDARNVISSYYPKINNLFYSELSKKIIALSLSMVIVFGSAFVSQSEEFANGLTKNSQRAVAFGESVFSGAKYAFSEPEMALNTFGELIAEAQKKSASLLAFTFDSGVKLFAKNFNNFVNEGASDLSVNFLSWFKDGNSITSKIYPIEEIDEEIENKKSFETKIAESRSPLVVGGITKVVERFTERVVSGVSSEELELKLQQLSNKLSGEIYRLSSENNGLAGYPSGVFTVASQAHRIDKLSNTTITNPTISGGSWSDANISGTLSGTFSGTISSGGTTTLNNLTVSNTSTSTFSGGVSSVRLNTSATSTLAGLQVATGGLTISTLNCSAFTNGGTLTTDSNGNVICDDDGGSSGGGTDGNWVFFNGSGIKLSTTTNQVLIGGSSTTSLAQLEVQGSVYSSGFLGIATTSPFAALSVVGNGFISGNLSLANISATGTLSVLGLSSLADVTFANATGTSFFATTASSTQFNTLNATSSQSFFSALGTFTKALFTDATTTSLFSTTASSTQFNTLNATSSQSFFSALGTFTKGLFTDATSTSFFANIASSTTAFFNNATSTTLGVTGNLTVQGAGTSTITNGLSVGGLTSSNGITVTGAGTSTLAGGINLTAGCFSINSTCVGSGSGTPGGSTGQIQYNNSGSFGGATGFIWDSANSRLGLGTTTPSGILSIYGATTTIQTPINGLAFDVLNSASTSVFSIDTRTGATTTSFFATTASSTQFNTLNATSSQSIFSALGTFTRGLFTDATTTSFFATTASSTQFNTLNATSSVSFFSTLGTFTRGLFTDATTTSLFSTTASTSALYVTGLSTCDSTTGKITYSNGTFNCGTDFNTGGGGGSDFTFQTHFDANTAATSSPVYFSNNLSASSTVRFGIATKPLFYFDSANGFLGLGTTTYSSGNILSIYGATTTIQTPINGLAFDVLNSASTSVFSIDTRTGATTTSFFATTASSTQFNTLNATSSQSFFSALGTFTMGLFTDATSTSFFATTASSTQFNTLNATSSQSFFSALGTFTKGLFTNATTSSFAVTGTATTTFGGPIASATGNFIIGSNTNTGNLLLQPYGGNVGIGTSTPNALLTISNFTASSSAATPAFFNITASTTGSSYGTTTQSSFFRISYASSTEIFGKVIDPEFISEEQGTTPGTTLNGANSVFVSGNYAYVANFNRASLAVIDISNPADPVFLSEELGPTPGTSLNGAASVFVSGNYAYVANFNRASLAVIDISNPADPVFLSEERGPTSLNGAYSVFVSGNYAYVANELRDSLAVIDISNPADPVFVSEERGPTPGTSLNGAASVFVSGNYAYVANFNRDSLAVIDISNPADPVFLSEELGPTPGTSLDGVTSVFVSGNYAYVANLTRDSLAVIDISNPADPVFVSEERGPTPGTSLDGAISVFVSGNYAYVANLTRDSLAVIDISNPADPVFLSEELGPTPGTSLDGATSVFVSGNYAYVANLDRDSLAVIDVGGASISNLAAGTAKIGNLQVDSFAQFAQGALFGGGLGVQGSIFGNNGASFTRVGTSSSLSSTTLAWGSTPVLPALSALVHDANIGSITDIFSISHTATGTVANGIGAGILFSTEVGTEGVTSSSTEATSTARIAAITTNISTSTPQSALTFSTKGTSGSLTEWARLDYGGNFGLGTTTPNWTLSVASITPYIAITDTDATLNNKHWLIGNNGGTFTIGTSTDTYGAPSTYFSINNTGQVSIANLLGTGSTTLTNASSTTFFASVASSTQFNTLNATSSQSFFSALGTFTRGLFTDATTTSLFSTTASTSALYVTGLSTCDSTTGKITYSNGTFNCGTDFNTGGGGGSDFTFQTHFDANTAATSSPVYFSNNLSASSTVRFGLSTKPLFYFDSANGFLGLGTTTYSSGNLLSIYGATTTIQTPINGLAFDVLNSASTSVFSIDTRTGATTTSFFATTASSTQFNTLNATSSQSIFSALGTFTRGLFTDATSTSFFATNASSTQFNTLNATSSQSFFSALGTFTRGLFTNATTSSLAVTGTATTTFGGPIASATGNFIIGSNTNTGNLLLQPYGGNIGIGTSTPNALLTISNFSASSSAATPAFFNITASTTGSSYGTTTQSSFFRISYASSTEIFGKVIDPEFISEEQGTTPGTTLNGANSVFVSGNYAYVANDIRDSLAVIDISNPADPVFLSEELGPTPGTSLNGAYSVFVSGNYAYVANSNRDSLAVIDISNPADPVFVSEERGPTPGTSLNSANSVFVSGNYAYVANSNRDSLAVIDISNPADPVFVSEELGPTPGTSLNAALSVFVSGNYAYVASNIRDSLAIIDISNPADPVFVSEELGPTPGTSLDGAYSVFVSGNYAYVANLDRDSLAVIDISNPADPVFISEERGPTPGTSLDVATFVFVSGNYAYVANSNRDSLAVIDISNPADPVFISEERGPNPGTSLDGAISVFVSGNYAYVANFNRASLAVIDVGGATISNLAAGTAKIGNLQVDSFAQFAQGALFGGGLGVQGSIFGNNGASFTRVGTSSSLSSTTLAWGSTPVLPALSALVHDANIGSITDIFSISHTATGTVANGIGAGILFSTEVGTQGVTSSSTEATSTARIAAITTNISTSTPQSALTFSTKGTSGSLTEWARLDYGGNFGLGTTTPNWTLSVASITPYIAITDTDATLNNKHWLLGNNGGTFTIGTSTDTYGAPSTYFSINNTGQVSIANLLGTGSTTLTNASSTTFFATTASSTQFNTLNATSSQSIFSALGTFTRGLFTDATTTSLFSTTASTSALYVTGLSTCDSTTGKITYSNGTFNCGTDFNTGGGGGSDFTFQTHFDANTAATSSPVYFSNNLSASSTVRFGLSTKPLFYFDSANGFLGLGTTTYSSGNLLSIYGATTTIQTPINGLAFDVLNSASTSVFSIDTRTGATTTSFFATTASSTQFNTLNATSSQSFFSALGTFTKGLFTDATTTSFFATTASSTQFNTLNATSSQSFFSALGTFTKGLFTNATTSSLAVTGTATTTFGGPIASATGNFIIGSNTNTGNLLLQPYGGNIGIGTSTPNALLTISNFTASSSAATPAFFNITASTTGQNAQFSSQSSFFRISYASSTEIFGKVIDPEFIAEERGPTPGTSLDTAISVFVSGNYAYLANITRDSLAVIDISNPADPVFVSEELGPTPGTSLNGAYSVFVSGNYAYVANSNRDSLAVIDISNPADPVFLSEELGPTPGTSLNGASSVFVSGNYAYLANQFRDSLAVIDISNPADPVFLSEELGPTPGTSLNGAISVFVSGNYAYVANELRDSLAVIDISNPVDPVFVSEERGPTPGTSLDDAFSVFVSGNYAYMANRDRDSLAVIDISNPADPVFLSEELGPTPGTSLDGAISVFVSGNYAYVANFTRNSLAVIDISNPADPVFISEELGPTPGTSLDGAYSVFVSGNYAYVANELRASLAVIDVGGATISNLAAGTAKIGNLQVDSFAQFAQGALFGGGLGVQGSIFANQGGSFMRIGTSSSLSSTTLAWGSTPVLPALSALVHDANIGSITDIFSISHTATGTVANGIGAGILFSTEVGTEGVTSSSTEATSTARIAAITTNISTSTPQSALTFSTKGTSGSLTEWARLDYGGNFGLGTTTPNWTLSVASITPYIAITDTDATLNNKHWLLGNNGGTFTIGTSTDSFSATSTYFSISNSGNVGVGTTTSYAKLGVEINDEAAFVVSNTGSSTPSIYIGSVNQNGFVGFGTTTNPASSLARLVIDNPSLGSTTGATSAVGGIFGVYTFNGNGGATQVGNRFVFQNAPTVTANTVVGEILRGIDNTSLANTFRAMEVTASGGSNTSGENTGIRTTGATFGLSATTLGTAGAVLAPAALYAETQGTTQGEALRGFSSTLTSGNFTHLFQQTSAFSGIGLKMDFGRGAGSFTGDFISLEVNDSPRFRIQAGGTTTIGDGTTSNQGGLQIGYGGLCVDNDGTCTASTTGRITAVEYNTANSDLAENYYSSEALEAGDIVYAMGGLQVGKAGAEAAPVIGVVSTKPGITLGAKESTGNGSEYAIGLSGRVPVKVSTENGSIKVGDRITLSSLSGIGMKDGDSFASPIVGIALETFDGSKYLSEETVAVETKQVQDGSPVCRTVIRPGGNIEYGGGGDIEDGKISNPSDSTIDLYDEICETKMITLTPDAGIGEEKTLATTTVKVGKIMLFINLDYRKSELSVTNEMAETSASDWQSNGWSVNQDSGKISVNFFGDVNLGGNALLDVGRIAGINSAWSIDETGALVVESIKAKRGQFENALEIGTKEKPTGVTIFDSATGEPACVRVSNGALVSSVGSCEQSSTLQTSTTGGSATETSTTPNLAVSPPSDTEAPVISLNGNNPATIQVGATYADLGATVTDNVNENLGYVISIDGVNYMDPSALSLDTIAPVTYTLTFKATDQAGNVGEAVRNVVVEALVAEGGSATEPPSATQPAQADPEPPPPTTENTQISEPSATPTP